MAHTRIKVGEFFEIPLPNGRFAYCQHVAFHQEFGFLIRVFKKVTDQPISSLQELQGVGEMFPPVFVGLREAVKSGGWKRTGFLPVVDFGFPMFKVTNGTKPGEYSDWYLWDGERERFIGKLPPELRSLELKSIWGYELLEMRVAYGTIPGAGLH